MSDDLVTGVIFAGRYRIERRIAAGGMGAVYEVMHLETSRRRALKVMHPDLVQNEDSRDRFRQEARVTAQIESEYIVDVFDAGIDESTSMPYLVMELLQGEEISKRIKRLERLSPHDTVLYLHQAALALDKTHRSRIVHRDLKPDNLFLCEREDGPPRIKLLDFGIAKIVAANAAATNATQAVGTPLYMAPEQFLADSMVSPATDLYALGMIAYTMLVGQTYWLAESKKGANVFAFAAYVTLGPQETASVRALRSGVVLPEAFDAWFSKATARKPENRFPTASVMISGLAEALGLPPPTAILAGAYAQGSGHPVAVAAPEPDRRNQALTGSLVGSSRTTRGGDDKQRSLAVVLTVAIAASLVLGLLYVVFSGPSEGPALEAASGEATASAKGLPDIVPVGSAITPTPPPTAPETFQPPPASSPSAALAPTQPRSAPGPAPAPGPKNTSAPTSTTKTKKGKWIRD